MPCLRFIGLEEIGLPVFEGKIKVKVYSSYEYAIFEQWRSNDFKHAVLLLQLDLSNPLVKITN